jgi:exodeoxyribonuclease V alpha subunit
METVRCKISKIIFRTSGEDGEFYILAVKDEEKRAFSVKGTTGYSLEAGQEILATGEMGTYREQPQLTAGLIAPVVPMTNDGAHGWIKSLPIDGIGDERATQLREAFPTDLHEALGEPERLMTVDGVGKVLAERLVEAWSGLEIPAEILELFNKLDLPMRIVSKIFIACGGANVMKICEERPWDLTYRVKGLGFKIADSIAKTLNVDMQSPARYQAAIDYVMAADVEGNGHTQTDKSFLVKRMRALGLTEDDRIEAALAGIKLFSQSGPYMRETVYIDDLTGLYSTMPSLRDETYLAERIVGMLQGPNRFESRRDFYEMAIEQVSKKLGIKLDPSQEAAALNCLCNPVSVITGGPGTGKSTTQSVILKVIQMEEEIDRSVRLVAPTGRAATRLGEVTGHEGSTIHRALEYTFEGFQRSESNPLEEHNHIADEFSMADVGLAAAFLRAVSPWARLIIVGDDQQLPSVSAGQVLADMIRSEVVPVARLTVIHRQAEESGIIQAAHRAAKGLAPEANGRDVFMLEAKGAPEILGHCRRLIEDTLPEMGYDPSQDMLLVTPQRKGPLGADVLNSVIKDYLNPEDEENPAHSQKLGGKWWSIGDRVMHLKNDVSRGVMNGEIGSVSSVEPTWKIERESHRPVWR